MNEMIAELERETRLMHARNRRLEQEVDILYTALRSIKESIEEGATFDYLDNIMLPKIETALRLVQRG